MGSAGLETLQDPLRRGGGSVSGEGSLGVRAQTVAPATRTRISNNVSTLYLQHSITKHDRKLILEKKMSLGSIGICDVIMGSQTSKGWEATAVWSLRKNFHVSVENDGTSCFLHRR